MSLHLYKFVSRDIMSLYKSTSDTRESLRVGRAGVSGCIRAAAGESCWPAKSFVFGSVRSSGCQSVRLSVRPSGTSLSKALNLHLSLIQGGDG